MSTGTIEGITATHALVQIPAWGIWYADVSLDQESDLSGAVTLALAGLTLRGTVLSGGSSVGRSRYRIVGGAGGWGKEISGQGYQSDAGVKASTVLVDAARLVGETLDASTLPAATVRLGAHFARSRVPASRYLEIVSPAAWYVGEDGVTRIGARASRAIAVAYQAEPVDHAAQSVRFAAEDLATITPGIIVEGIEAADVAHELTPRGLRSTIWGSSLGAGNRRMQAYRRIFDQLYPRARYAGVYEFRVVTIEGNRLNLQPIRVSSRLPSLERVGVRGGLAGARAVPALGSRVVVAFLDSDPSFPVVIGFEEPDVFGFGASAVYLSESPDLLVSTLDSIGRVVRYGDPIVFATPGPGVVSIAVPSPLSKVRA